jgi:hypothetical protein
MGEQAFYRLSARIISRSKGHTVVGLAAYLAAEKLHDERYGESRHYAKRQYQERHFHSEILAPPEAPAWVYDRQELYNRVEAAERRRDSQLVREVTLSFPVELDHYQKQEAARRFVREQYVSKGMVADINYHNFLGAGEANPHAHILLTMRRLEGDNFAAKKTPEWQPRFSKNDTCSHAQGDLLLQERMAWQKCLNRALLQAGRSEKADCRSLKDRGIERLPEPKKGKAQQMELRSVWQGRTRAMEEWQEVRELNALREEKARTDAEIAELQKAMAQLQLDAAIERSHEVLRQRKKARQSAQDDMEKTIYQQAAQELKQSEREQRALMKKIFDQNRER